MAEFPDHPFWDFSFDVYMSEGVGAACLELQDAHELDVNILLFCIWVGASGRGSLTTDQMSTVTGAVADWHHEVVRALRTVLDHGADLINLSFGEAASPPNVGRFLAKAEEVVG